MTRRHRIGILATAAVVVASLVMPTWAWAKYRAVGSETNVFATHILLEPGQPSCTGFGVLSVTLAWTAASDAAYVLSYELRESGSVNGPFALVQNVGNVTSVTIGISSGTHYYVVRPINHGWNGPDSDARRVNGILFLAATCP